MTSIERAQNSKTKAQEVRMMLVGLSKILVIVEGKDDKKLYSKFLDNSECEIFPLGGCKYFEEILNVNAEKKDQFLIIKDSDFDVILGHEYDAPNLFRTDGHDAEMMEITDGFWNSFKAEYLDNDDDDLALLKTADSDIIQWSYCKLYDRATKKGFSMPKLSLVYAGRCPTDISQCVEVINRNNADNGLNMSLVDVSDIKKKYPNPDLRQITNGHDMCDAIVYKYKIVKKHQMRKGELCEMLRIRYTKEEFQRTTLYKDLFNWSMKHNKSILL